MIYNYL